MSELHLDSVFAFMQHEDACTKQGSCTSRRLSPQNKKTRDLVRVIQDG